MDSNCEELQAHSCKDHNAEYLGSHLHGQNTQARPQALRAYHSDFVRGNLAPLEQPSPSSVVTSNSFKQPARSYFHSSYHALGPSFHTETAASHPSQVVREQTAELASIALEDAAHSFQSKKISPTALGQLKPSSTDEIQVLPSTESLLRSAATRVGSDTNESISALPVSYSRHPKTSYLTHLLRTSPQIISEASTKPNKTDLPHHVQGSSESEALLSQTRESPTHRGYNSIAREGDCESLEARSTLKSNIPTLNVVRAIAWPKIKAQVDLHNNWGQKGVWDTFVKRPIGYIPAVILGLLLNVLDGLSYGMILFPLGHAIFSGLQPDGLSMFYISCIISQLVYSFGGSRFKGGVGSEMIEVVPFFHKMAFTILAKVGEENPRSVLATTILAFSASSVLTGLVFFALGALKLGSLTGFFPRHILLGCIGGVGWFLLATGVEVSARLEGTLRYDLQTLMLLLRPNTLALWSAPLSLAILLTICKKYIKIQFLDALFFVSVLLLFYLLVAIIPNLNFRELRELGWVFEQPEANVPWWHFYTLYDFEAINWGALASTIPAMFALTFFGILHVPINVPALGVSTGVDDLDVDRELIAHGVSNALSGLAGSIQNYLVYTNSILFIRSGGDSRVAGVMLAFATVAIMIIGPGIIGYIPVMVVGALIFYLGMELLREALYDTWRKVHLLEYLTIVTIVVTMGVWDFVIGILLGIALACLSYVLQTSKVPPIRALHTGAVARSTVRRHPIQQRYLQEVGSQIFVISLTGYMFFGTVGSVEKTIRELLDEDNFQTRHIRYLILSLSHVTGIDFSAAEAFTRIRRTVETRKVQLIISGVTHESEVGKGLQSAGVWSDEGVQVYENLNAALESCENELLVAFYRQRDHFAQKHLRENTLLEVPQSNYNGNWSNEATSSSPRRNHAFRAAASTLKENFIAPNKWQNFKQPLPLMLQTFQEMTDKNEDFWFKACAFFKRKVFSEGEVVFRYGAKPDGFYIVEEGILVAEYDFEQGKFSESIVPGTTCGELPFFSETPRTATVIAEKAVTAWVLDEDDWHQLQKKHGDVAYELLKICLKLTTERLNAITRYILTNAG